MVVLEEHWYAEPFGASGPVLSVGIDTVKVTGATHRLQFGHASQEQTTVGAPGSASPLPAVPSKYFKVKDSSGTEYVIPAFAVS